MRLRTSHGAPGGFTLTELLIVMVIIGIVVALIAVASADSVRRAEERATQTLIVKLETGLNDRIDALLGGVVDVSNGHRYLATSSNSTFGAYPQANEARAQVIARIDYLRREIPEVFFVQSIPNAVTGNVYPINFGSVPYLGGAGTPGTLAAAYTPHAPHVLPLGRMAIGTSGYTLPPLGVTLPAGDYGATAESIVAFDAGTGIYGASYTARSALLKNLGNIPGDLGTPAPLLQTGYDGSDNDGDFLVDEWDEGVNASNLAAVQMSLTNHTHKSARSEMLYALLIEAQGPFGSVFTREDFTPREVADTDNDGLPEFVDAWGEPLQFFLWPTHFRSEIQKGMEKYAGISARREISPQDPSQQLVSLAWWSSGALFNNVQFPGMPASGSTTMSSHALEFQRHFFSLWDPNTAVSAGLYYNPADVVPNSPSTLGTLWDRGDASRRRSYLAKFLIVSGGPDKTVGLPSIPPDSTAPGFPDSYSLTLITVENQAAPVDPSSSTRSGPLNQIAAPAGDLNNATTYALFESGQDDISNHELQAGGGGAIR